MTCNWTDGPELSILLVRANGRDYAAEVNPEDEHMDYFWQIYRDQRWEKDGTCCHRDTAKREAEQALTALIEKDFNESMGDTE